MPNHILVVDDDPAIRKIVRDILDWEGCRVRTVGNGQEALETIAADPPSVVLLDLWMPVLDGWGLARELQQRGLTVPIVVMTAGRDARSLAADIHAAGYLAKPFALDELIESVSRFAPCPPTPEPAVAAQTAG